MSSKDKCAVAGEQDQQGGLVPKLRFPEFRDAPAWELWPLKKLAKRRTRKNVGAKIDRVLTNSAEHGVVDQRDYFEKDIANPGNLDGYFMIEKGDYVYNPRVSNLAPVGPIHKNDIGLGVMSPLYTVFFFDSAENEFYSHYFKTPHWHQYLRHVSNSGARHDRMAISADDFISMPVPVSNPMEQQKIADCLSSIDTLIAAEADKLEALKDHKKGLLQQLFPAPGETTPRLRFSKFQGAGNWQWKQLGEILTTIAPPQKLPTSDYQQQGDFPIIDQGQNLIAGWTNDAGSVLMGPLPVVVFGDHTCTLKFVDFPFAQGADGIKILESSGTMTVDYLYSVLQAYPVNSGEYKRHFTDLKRNFVAFPDVKTGEQQMIAKCISSIEKLIILQKDRLEDLDSHKSALFNQLFPYIENY